MSNHSSFGDPMVFLQLFREAGLDQDFGFDEDTPFLVESAFLRYWNQELGQLPEEEGLETIEACPLPVKHESENCAHIWIVYQDDDQFEELYFIFAINDEHPGQYALTITQNDNVMYARNIDQDPATEWQINCMAGDPTVTDADGKMLFDGETHNA